MKKKLIMLLAAGVFIIGVAVSVAANIYLFASQPADKFATETIIFKILPGQSFNRISDHLHQQNLISSPLKFKVIARFNNHDRNIIAGEYALSPAMTPLQILKKLSDGIVELYRLSIPEGYTLHQIAEKVEAAGFCDRRTFIRAAADATETQKLGIEANTLEGFLFPDTYYFSGDISPEQIISAMVERFRQVFLPEWEKRAENMGFSVLEIVILASIIEKETGVASERPVISSVFHNRLKQNMRLGSDPTVIYGIEAFDGNITRKHLTTPTPYNTYVIRGLPPGPIASPGAAALHAALFPADTDYLYFVAKPDRTHYFSKTLEAHNRAVRKYQLGR